MREVHQQKGLQSTCTSTTLCLHKYSVPGGMPLGSAKCDLQDIDIDIDKYAIAYLEGLHGRSRCQCSSVSIRVEAFSNILYILMLHLWSTKYFNVYPKIRWQLSRNWILVRSPRLLLMHQTDLFLVNAPFYYKTHKSAVARFPRNTILVAQFRNMNRLKHLMVSFSDSIAVFTPKGQHNLYCL